MDIQLKHLKFFRQLSRGTVCFEANVWVNGRKIGTAMNSGDGGASRFDLDYPPSDTIKELYRDAKDYCEQLPDRIIKVPAQFKVPGNEIKAKMDFIEYIDMLVDEAWEKEEENRINRFVSKAQVGSILFGDVDGSIFEIKLGTQKHRIKIEDLLNSDKGKEALKNKVSEVKSKLKQGQKILNTNIPTDLL